MEIYKRSRLPTLAVVILNYNGTKWLHKFLYGIVEHSLPYPVYVIDNGSTDNSVLYLTENYPSVKVVLNNENYGYAEGYNKGLKNIQEDIYCLLNSDIEVTQNWITPILNLFNSNEGIAVVQPKILDYKKKNYFEFAGAAGGFIDNLGYPYCRGRIFYDLEEDKGQYNDIQEIFWATGAAFFIRKEDFWQEGGFDSTFFAHMEEIDLCWRLKNKGRKIYYCGNSIVYHVGGGTLTVNSPKKTYLNFRNNLVMLIKNLPKEKVFILIFLRLSLDGIAGVKFLLSRQYKNCFAIVEAHFSFYRMLPKALRKRKPGILKYYDKKNILFQYFIKKRRKYSNLK